MEERLFVETVRRLNRSRPFRQFEIEQANGVVIRVAHPDAMAYNERLAVVLTSDGLAQHVDPQRVLSVRPTDEPPAPGGPGLKDDLLPTTDH